MSEVPLYVLGLKVLGFTAAEREENTFKGFEDLCLKNGSSKRQHLVSTVLSVRNWPDSVMVFGSHSLPPADCDQPPAGVPH